MKTTISNGTRERIGSAQCGESAVWKNMYTTNGSYYKDERIDGYVELELAKKAPTCTCHCGHVHTTGPAVYKLPPKDVGHHVVIKQTKEKGDDNVS
ncbi:hypothetical protein LCGC14_1428460 [marine sediment metagenome]|uniref:Uncharacterized protein n=1 Tax=marine sediment metagenome TaxID=412755 RepID=A0A0F9MR07_9ZZZZ